MRYLKRLITVLGMCGILLINNITAVSSVSQEAGAPASSAAQSGCSVIYNGGNGWVIDMCATDPGVATPMQVLVNGVSKGNAALVRIYHQKQNGSSTPQVAVIYASGYVRLKQNADPSPSNPFGASFVLGPAYWPGLSTYYHNPQLNHLEFDTTWLPNAPLRMNAQGTNHDFNVTYEMTLPPPRDRQTRLHVTQTYAATANININPTRRAERQGFKLVQASSMFIKKGSPCDGGYTDCHDSNGARFIGNDLARHQVDFENLTLPALVFGSPIPLSTTWLDVLHTDDKSWQSATGANTSGNTPNVRIALDELPITHTITPQGWIDLTTNPNDDRVGLWLHDDGPASASWLAGQSGQVGYWLLAQDNPPEPWADLGLRPGLTFLEFEGSYNCFPDKIATQPATATLTAINGYTNTALQLNYNIGNTYRNWAQIRCDFNPPLNLSSYDHLRFDWRGDPATANSMEVGLISGGRIFAPGYNHLTQHGWWGQMVIPFKHLLPWTPNTQFDPSNVNAMIVSVVKDKNDTGGAGSIAIDNLSAYNVGSRTVPGTFESVVPNPSAAQAAASWLASQQKSTGLLRSWEKDPICWAYTYDQALALIVFSDQGMWTQADALVNRLIAIQNADGSWYQNRDCETLVVPVDSKKWEGDIAWAVYALSRYLDLGGTNTQAATAEQRGADWLATLINPVDGCPIKDHDFTEATIDAWWAFQAAGANHAANAEKIKNCLLTYYWDDTMGRFKGGRDRWQPYLDNQTWGAAFLNAIGETAKARRTLSYARDVLRLPAQGGQLFGFDGQGGPWSVWNEGTAQYVAVGGDGARDLLLELLAQQKKNGAMLGSPDNFNGGGVWTTRWHGVAPTAWLYNALSGEPFHASPTNTDIYIRGTKQGSYYVPTHGSIRVNFTGVDSGPVRIRSTNNVPIVAGLRELFSVNGVPTSSFQLMGLPVSQLSDTYVFPSYNNVTLNEQVRFGNVDVVDTNVTVTIGGIPMGTYPLSPNQQVRVNYAGVDSGPVKVQSSGGVKIIAAIRDAWFENGTIESFSQLMGLPATQLSDTYWFPSYNNITLNEQLRFGNVGIADTNVTVTIGATSYGPYLLHPNEQFRVNYPGVDSGPVKVQSTGGVKIITAIREAWFQGSAVKSWIQLMGLPGPQLSDTYYLPAYDNVSLNGQLRFGNVGASNTTVTVTIGGVVKGSYPLAPNEQFRVNYASLDSGPVVIKSSGGVKIIAALRDALSVNGIVESFAQMMGLPGAQLSTTYWFPSYNNVTLDEQLRFGAP